MGLNKNMHWEHALPEDYLELSGGETVTNIGDLIGALEKMDKDSFEIHVYKNQNDFSEWIREAYGNDKLAKAIFKTKRKQKIINLLKKELEKPGFKAQDIIQAPKKKKDILKILRGAGDV